MRRDPPNQIHRLRGIVFDTDQWALDVVEHWGYQRYELCHVSRLDLADATSPTVVPDVAIEACPDLRFADDDAVLAMLDRAETNPERAHGLFVTPTMMRSLATGGTPVGFVARVAGAPIGLIHGSVSGDRMLITYLCVDPPFRGRGIALTLKKRLHDEGRRLGATHVITGKRARQPRCPKPQHPTRLPPPPRRSPGSDHQHLNLPPRNPGARQPRSRPPSNQPHSPQETAHRRDQALHRVSRRGVPSCPASFRLPFVVK